VHANLRRRLEGASRETEAGSIAAACPGRDAAPPGAVKRFTYLPDLLLGAIYLVAWAAPHLVGEARVSWLILGIELELVALLGAYLVSIAHIAILDRTAEMKTRLAGVAIVVVLVGFAIVQIQRYEFWWPAAALAVLLANRLAGVLTGALQTEDARMALFVGALWSIGLYVVAVGPTFYFPVPAPGAALGPLPPEHARWCALPADLVSDFFDHPVEGSWCAEPRRALAGGALYFLISALRGAHRARKAALEGRAAARRPSRSR
jgi:hypothetical protein